MIAIQANTGILLIHAIPYAYASMPSYSATNGYRAMAHMATLMNTGVVPIGDEYSDGLLAAVYSLD